MEFLLSLITPVLLHMAVSVIVTAAGGAIGGAAADSAVCTSVTALLVLPVLIWMYRSDAAKGMHSNKSTVVLTERSKKTSIPKHAGHGSGDNKQGRKKREKEEEYKADRIFDRYIGFVRRIRWCPEFALERNPAAASNSGSFF